MGRIFIQFHAFVGVSVSVDSFLILTDESYKSEDGNCKNLIFCQFEPNATQDNSIEFYTKT